MTDSYTRIRLFYRDTTGNETEHDTLDFDFNINSNCAFFIMNINTAIPLLKMPLTTTKTTNFLFKV